jgi:hypothetical protein
MQLRVDGVLSTLGPTGIDLGSGGRVTSSAVGGGIEIEFPNGTHLIVTPGWWSSQSKWYLNVNVSRTPAQEGIMGAVADGWLPRLPDGTSIGPRPAALHDRYVDLYNTFGDAWRVTHATSLFDYAPGASTTTFTYPAWPPESLPCVVPEQRPVEPLDPRLAQEACRGVRGQKRNPDCVFDVTVMGEPRIAETYAATERLLAGATATTLSDDPDPTKAEEKVTFTAVVEQKAPDGKGTPTGTVQFFLDGAEAGEPVKLDEKGRALWTTAFAKDGTYAVTAVFTPGKGSELLPSTSNEETHTVGEKKEIPVK